MTVYIMPFFPLMFIYKFPCNLKEKSSNFFKVTDKVPSDEGTPNSACKKTFAPTVAKR